MKYQATTQDAINKIAPQINNKFVFRPLSIPALLYQILTIGRYFTDIPAKLFMVETKLLTSISLGSARPYK